MRLLCFTECNDLFLFEHSTSRYTRINTLLYMVHGWGVDTENKNVLTFGNHYPFSKRCNRFGSSNIPGGTAISEGAIQPPAPPAPRGLRVREVYMGSGIIILILKNDDIFFYSTNNK